MQSVKSYVKGFLFLAFRFVHKRRNLEEYLARISLDLLTSKCTSFSKLIMHTRPCKESWGGQTCFSHSSFFSPADDSVHFVRGGLLTGKRSSVDRLWSVFRAAFPRSEERGCSHGFGLSAGVGRKGGVVAPPAPLMVLLCLPSSSSWVGTWAKKQEPCSNVLGALVR